MKENGHPSATWDVNQARIQEPDRWRVCVVLCMVLILDGILEQAEPCLKGFRSFRRKKNRFVTTLDLIECPKQIKYQILEIAPYTPTYF